METEKGAGGWTPDREFCEAIVRVILVFPNSFFEDIGHPTVEGTILLAGHEVEIVLPHSGSWGRSGQVTLGLHRT